MRYPPGNVKLPPRRHSERRGGYATGRFQDALDGSGRLVPLSEDERRHQLDRRRAFAARRSRTSSWRWIAVGLGLAIVVAILLAAWG